jgi:hypothetical protein
VTAGTAASFRDPAGFVFRREGTLYRQIDASYREHYDHLMASGLYEALVAGGLLVRHEEVEPRLAATPGAYRVIRPEPLPFISYPFEWSFGQLRDAALLTLDVMREALAHGMILRDGTAFNVQFRGSRPVFIDTLSFGRYRDGQPWYGYRQFCEFFLAPLALMARRDVRLGGLLRRFPNGLPLDMAASLLDAGSRLRLGLLLHIHLHARAQRKYADAVATTRRVEQTTLERMVEHLRQVVEGLRWVPEGTVWADYEETHGYSESAVGTKQRLVDDFLARVRPRTVWDLGANTGAFSRLAADRGARVVAVEGDAGAAERHYRRLRAAGDERILPLLVDLLDPTPRTGWASEERMSLADRGPADAVLALALIHHLTLGGNVPLARVAEFFARIGRVAIVEWVPADDPQARRLVMHRPERPLAYSREAFEAAFGAHFEIAAIAPVEESGRTLFLLTRSAK